MRNRTFAKSPPSDTCAQRPSRKPHQPTTRKMHIAKHTQTPNFDRQLIGSKVVARWRSRTAKTASCARGLMSGCNRFRSTPGCRVTHAPGGDHACAKPTQHGRDGVVAELTDEGRHLPPQRRHTTQVVLGLGGLRGVHVPAQCVSDVSHVMFTRLVSIVFSNGAAGCATREGGGRTLPPTSPS